MRITLWSAAPLALFLTIGCAANPKPGEPGYPYNLDGVYESTFVVAGTSYQGTTELRTGPGGTVRGDFSLVRPVSIVGELTGTLAGDSLSFSGTYTQAGGCDGTVSGSGVVGEGATRVDGSLQVDDSCGGLLDGTFAFHADDA